MEDQVSPVVYKERMAQSKTKHLLVAAIDFGTTYSGWAFSFRHEFETNPTKVSAKAWPGGQLVSSKGPTCALIKPDGQTLDSFGYEAESKYAELADGDCHKEWYFFKRFKMMLFNQIGINRDIVIEDASGKAFSAKKVFSLCIGYLRKNLIEESEQRIADIGLTDRVIHWVLTVPAIWTDAAKQFMREAAEAPEAGIPGDMLTIALEPEAASLFCRYLPVEKCIKGQSSFGCFQAKTKYLVLDAGGGTVDITVHEVTKDGNLKELHKASGGAWGGTIVDDAFRTFLGKLFGDAVIENFQKNHMESYIDFFRSFEIKKQEIAPSKEGKITFTLPFSLLKLLPTGTEIKDEISKSAYAHQIKVMNDKIRVDADVIKSFFSASVTSVIDHVARLLKEPKVRGCKSIVMVGGFSESPMLQERIRQEFPNMKLVIPEEAGLAVLKGAVIYGHNPTTIALRICKFTYGTASVHEKSDTCTHPLTSTYTDEEGNIWCNSMFSIHVKAGQPVKVGEEQPEQKYKTSKFNKKKILFDMYASSSPNPQLTTESGCSRIGSIEVPRPGSGKRRVTMSLKFGGTEIEVKVTNKTTGEVTIKHVDFLG